MVMLSVSAAAVRQVPPLYELFASKVTFTDQAFSESAIGPPPPTFAAAGAFSRQSCPWTYRCRSMIDKVAAQEVLLRSETFGHFEPRVSADAFK
jgi:hypothetical protein